MDNQRLTSMFQSIVRAMLIWASAKFAVQVNDGQMNELVGYASAGLCTLASLGWSYFNHGKNIDTVPPATKPVRSGGKARRLGSLMLMCGLLGVASASTVYMTGCEQQVTAADLAHWRSQADAAEADMQREIDSARAAGNTAAADKGQEGLDRFRAERAKYEQRIITDAEGNLDVESSIGTALVSLAPPGIGAGLLAVMALVKRWKAGGLRPPSPPTT